MEIDAETLAHMDYLLLSYDPKSSTTIHSRDASQFTKLKISAVELKAIKREDIDSRLYNTIVQCQRKYPRFVSMRSYLMHQLIKDFGRNGFELATPLFSGVYCGNREQLKERADRKEGLGQRVADVIFLRPITLSPPKEDPILSELRQIFKNLPPVS